MNTSFRIEADEGIKVTVEVVNGSIVVQAKHVASFEPTSSTTVKPKYRKSSTSTSATSKVHKALCIADHSADKLSEAEKNEIHLYYEDGMSLSQISELFNISLETVREYI